MLWWVAQMAMEYFLFTSESVNEGHPDKLADQVGPSVFGFPFAASGYMAISFDHQFSWRSSCLVLSQDVAHRYLMRSWTRA